MTQEPAHAFPSELVLPGSSSSGPQAPVPTVPPLITPYRHGTGAQQCKTCLISADPKARARSTAPSWENKRQRERGETHNGLQAQKSSSRRDAGPSLGTLVKGLHTSARNGMAGPRGATGQWCKRTEPPAWGYVVHGHGQSLKQSIAKLMYVLQRQPGARTKMESQVTWEHQQSTANTSLLSYNLQEWI